MAWTPPPTPSPTNTPVENIIFIDVETVPCVEEFNDLPEPAKKLFDKKVYRDVDRIEIEAKQQGDDITREFILGVLWRERAALLSEFSQIVCISIGLIVPGQVPRLFRTKSFAGRNEEKILQEILPKLQAAKFLCAHNGKRFDFPLLCRKFIQYKIELPPVLQVIGLKPWEVRLFDTMETWQFTGIENVSLDALAYMLALPSPKVEMSGADVAPLYYENGELPWEEDDNLKKIATYCQGDVLTMANAYLRMIGQSIISPENVVIV